MPSDGLPSQAEVEAALFQLLKEKGVPVEPAEAYRLLGNRFELTQEQRHRVLTTEPRSERENLIRFARRRLVDNGTIDKSIKGKWALTQLGQLDLDL